METKYLPSKILHSNYYFGVFSFSPNKGWMELTFLGKFDSEDAANRAIIRYINQPENKSASKELYQIRAVITENLVISEFEYNPDEDVLYTKNITENSK